MRSLSLLLLASLALTLPSLLPSPSPCTALQMGAPTLSATLKRTFAAGDPASSSSSQQIFIPTYGYVTLPSFVSPSSIPGYDAATRAVSNQYAQQAMDYLAQFGLIDAAGGSSTAGIAGGGPDGGMVGDSSSTGVMAGGGGGGGVAGGNSTSNGNGDNGNANGNDSGMSRNGAGSRSPLSWQVCGAAVALAMTTAGAVGML